MANLADQVRAILGHESIIAPDDTGSIPSGGQSATGSDDRSTGGSESSNPPDSTRPRGAQAVNPSTAESTPDNPSDTRGTNSSRGGSGRGTRSRRTGSDTSNSRAKSDKNETTFDLGDLWLILNNIMAYSMDASELKIDPEEAKAMGEAMRRLMKFYKPSMLSPLQMAWLNLVGTFGVVYGVRIWNMMQRKAEDSASKTVNIGPQKI